MVGGDGDDIFHVDDALDRAAGQGGTDEIRTNLASFTLGDLGRAFDLAAAVQADSALAGTRLCMLTSAGQRGDAQRCRDLGIRETAPMVGAR